MDESLKSLLYRYWFWAWMFMDMSRSRDAYQRAAAWRHNVAQRRYLTIYMRRWLVLCALNFAVGGVLEKPLALMLPAAVFYTNFCLAVCVLAFAFIGWVFLGQPADRGAPLR